MKPSFSTLNSLPAIGAIPPRTQRLLNPRPLLSGALASLLLACSGGKFEAVPDAGSPASDSPSDADDNGSATTDNSELPTNSDAGPDTDGAAPSSDDTTNGGTTSDDTTADESDDAPDDGASDTDEPPTDDTADEPSTNPDDTGAPNEDDDIVTDPSTEDGGSTNTPGTSDTTDASVTNDDVATPDEPDASDATDPTSPPGTECSLGDNICLDSGLVPTPTDTVDASVPGDECPDIAEQLLRGSCGCGFASDPICEELEAHIVHRYSFDGTGKQVIDSVGGADGEAIDVELDGSGELELDGNSQHVVLPAGIASESNNATFEAWVIWHGGDNSQRVFNFGTPVPNETPQQFISFTPASGNDGSMAVSVRIGNADSGTLRADWGLPTGSVQHLTTVFDGDASEVRLYIGTELVEILEHAFVLQDLADSVNYLGRALYDAYPTFDGSLLEFRVYDVALDLDQVSQSDALGESATFSAAP